MLIFLKQKMAVLSMPKTGTTALEAALAPHADIIFSGNPRNKHMTLRKFDRFMRPYLASLGLEGVETTCLLREPVDWLGSWYRYRQRAALDGRTNSTAGISFEEFVSAYMAEPQPGFAQVGNPARFVSDKGGMPAIDHLFAYEAFDQYVAFLEQRLERSFTIGRANRSPAGDLSLSAQAAKAISEHMKDAVALHASLVGKPPS